MPADLSANTHAAACPAADELASSANPFSLDIILQEERTLGGQSEGIIYGSSPYDKGRPALLGDFQILQLVLQRLRSVEARTMNMRVFRQGIYLMGTIGIDIARKNRPTLT